MENVVTARRLKELREEKGLSHSKLSQALHDKFNVTVSEKQLMHYESAYRDEYHVKADSVYGMAARILFALSSFYNVSADYILGISDIKSIDKNVEAIYHETGLSEESITTLKDLNNPDFPDPDFISFINLLVENYGCTKSLSSNFFHYLFAESTWLINSSQHILDLDKEQIAKSISPYLQYITIFNNELSKHAQQMDGKFWESLFLNLIEKDLSDIKNNVLSNENKKAATD